MKVALIIAAGIGLLIATAASAQTASICPDNFQAFAGTTEPLACTCTADAVKHADSRQNQYPVEGMDIYTASSPICLAAVHAGVIGRSGGTLTVIPEAGRQAYAGVTRNGITSRNSRAEKSSFRFAAAPAPATTPAPATAGAPAAASVCPDNFEAFAGTTEPLACTCTADAVKHADSRQHQYPVEGMDIYTASSPVCLAAVHAGVIGRNGGTLNVIPEAGRQAYAGVTRNGITSRNARAEKSSFRFGAAAAPAATPAPATTPSAPAAASVCPDNFQAFAGTTEPLACTCAADAVKHADSRQHQYPVEGMDTYTGSSPVCLAAVHAGVIGRNGGALTVIPEAGRNAYPGVTRNGVTSRNARAEKSSFRFAAPAQPVVVGDKPVQQPIAATIQQTGQVQLYIPFKFDSAELDEQAAPTLMELRDALVANPNLRLMLVGHTDSVGTPNYNRSLSLRRAQSVMSWLAAQGVPRSRLAVDGKGQDQPIADNATEQGRALNRRVQALRVQ
jgi:outer membrane protein OmpA-like peptidoglycan-associated protein